MSKIIDTSEATNVLTIMAMEQMQRDGLNDVGNQDQLRESVRKALLNGYSYGAVWSCSFSMTNDTLSVKNIVGGYGTTVQLSDMRMRVYNQNQE